MSVNVLVDKHAGEQHLFVDALAERIQMWGGVSDVIRTTEMQMWFLSEHVG